MSKKEKELALKLIDVVLDDCKIGGKSNRLTYEAYKLMEQLQKSLENGK